MGTCCKAAPPVLEFDAEGQAGAGLGPGLDGRLLELAAQPARHLRRSQRLRLGRHLQAPPRDEVHARRQAADDDRQYDKNAGSTDTTLLGGPAGIWVDPQTNEAYISDGYRNRRVIVFDGATGKYLRHWGAYGENRRHREVRSEDDGERRAAEAVLDAARHHRLEGREDLRRRPPRQPHPGVRPPGQIPRRESDRAGDAVVRIRVRAGAFARPAADSGSMSPTERTTRCGFCGAPIWKSSASSAAAAGRWARCCARTA